MLVHPKDNRTPQENAGVVYQVLVRIVHVCTLVRQKQIGVRERDHQRNVRSLEEVKFTWTRMKDSVSELHHSAITDHIARNNHAIDWEGVKFPSRDSDTTKRGIWEAIAIKKTGAHAMNRDGGGRGAPPTSAVLHQAAVL